MPQPKRSDASQTNNGKASLHLVMNVLQECINMNMNVKQISASVFFPQYLAVAPVTTHAADIDGGLITTHVSSS